MITQVSGFRVGHATDLEALTGCTVILCPPGTVGGCDVRGAAPGTRETALLAPDKHIQEVHAVLLTGGSAFGLAAADGVMRYLREQGIGYETPWARVPIVPAAVVFDLFLGRATSPDAEMGYRACLNASDGRVPQGNVGAGAGVTVGKWAGLQTWMKGGLGTAGLRDGDLVVGALAVINAVGDVVEDDGTILAGARSPDGVWLGERDPLRRFPQMPVPDTNTTLLVVATNARLTKVEANRLAQRAHDGLARAVRPAHTTHDGDTAFGLATGQVEAPFDLAAEMGAEACARAIRNAVRHAASVPGAPGWREVTQG